MSLPSSVSFTTWLTQVVSAVFFCLTCTGVVFGFAALKPVLIQEGVYAEYCTEDEIREQVYVCRDQDLRLNFMFTLGAVVTNVAALPVGVFLDRYGPRTASLIGAVVFALGNFFLGLQVPSNGPIDTYIAGFTLLALGGPLIFLPSFHLSNAFPSYSGLVLAAMTGAFDASSIPWVIYRAMYNSSEGGVSLRTFFWAYMIFPLLLFVEQIVIAPTSTYVREADPAPIREPDERTNLLSNGDHLEPGTSHPTPPIRPELLGRNSSAFSRIYYEETEEEGLVKTLSTKDKLTGKLFGLSATEQIGSTWFWVVVFFLCVHMCRINFFIQTCFQQLVYFTKDRALAESLTTTFTILLPIGGLTGAPFVGLLLDKGSTFASSLVLVVSGLLFGLLGFSSSVVGQVVGIAIFVFFRPLMYTFVSHYSSLVFGFTTFGTVYGLANSISGLFGLVQTPLDILSKDPRVGGFGSVDAVLVVAGLVSSGLLSWRIWSGTRSSTVEGEGEGEGGGETGRSD